MKKADIGLIGLAVMGENLIMNMESGIIEDKAIIEQGYEMVNLPPTPSVKDGE